MNPFHNVILYNRSDCTVAAKYIFSLSIKSLLRLEVD